MPKPKVITIHDDMGRTINVSRKVPIDGSGVDLQIELDRHTQSQFYQRYTCPSLTPAKARRLAAAILEFAGKKKEAKCKSN